MPSPLRIGSPNNTPSGETIAVQQPPRSAFCTFTSGVMEAIWASVSQPVALITKQPDSSA